MSDVMRPIPFESLLKRVFGEYAQGSVFGILKENFYKDTRRHNAKIFSNYCSTVLGPAAGPHTQLCQNIIASYLTGSRFIELKTVQIMDQLDIAKPCIDARDEGYNVEWSSEYTLPKARDEYYKAWIVCNFLDMLLSSSDWVSPSFVFNMSVGYNLEGIKNPRMQQFIDGMRNAASDQTFRNYLAALDEFVETSGIFDGTDLAAAVIRLRARGKVSSLISPNICKSVTISTMHGCPPTEIEAICSYMIAEKGIDTFVKLNPTLLGFYSVREILDATGFDYVQLSHSSFDNDLQYEDAIPMLRRLKAKASDCGRCFGVKLTNTLGNINDKGMIPGDEMYMSGRSLFPIATALAAKISAEFGGDMPISYSGGVNIFNVEALFKTGIRPITLATDMLHPGGYNRMTQMAEKLNALDDRYFDASRVDVAAIEQLSKDALTAKYSQKSFRGLKQVKVDDELTVTDCFVSPCEFACPIHQAIPAYVKEAEKGADGALNAMFELYDYNALPNIVCEICDHKCQDNCTRLDYEGEGVQIRGMKKYAVETASEKYEDVVKGDGASGNGLKVAVVGAGPAGLASAIFLREYGYDVDVYEKEAAAGGVVRSAIPDFRIDSSVIDRDYMHAVNLGVNFKFNVDPDSVTVSGLKEKGYERIFYCIGCPKERKLEGLGDKSRLMTSLDFLAKFKTDRQDFKPGANIVVVGGGNTAMDVARAALKLDGVRSTTVLYRRTEEDMPADKEEIESAKAAGVKFVFLGTPQVHKNGNLIYMKMRKEGRDAKGRNIIYATEWSEIIPCDFIVTALGQVQDTEAARALGLEVDSNNRIAVDKETCATESDGIYVVGDAATGASTVIKCVASARAAADTLFFSDMEKGVFHDDGEDDSETEDFGHGDGCSCDSCVGEERDYVKKLRMNHGKVMTAKPVYGEPGYNSKVGCSCLDCETFCGKCVDVCPNRANVVIDVSDDKYSEIFENLYQIVHVDAYCNECGNCASFCPHKGGRPYKDKFTIFSTYADLRASVNDGFFIYQGKAYVRDDGKAYVANIKCGIVDNPKISLQYKTLIRIICNEYPYLLTKMGV